jgi:3-methylfumaryl-CoA hydratase
MTETIDIAALQAWVGRSETRSDVVTAQLVTAFRATVCEDATAGNIDMAPAGIHWCLAPATVPMSEVGPDGHPARGGFLPPVPLPRRMWAGSRIDFLQPLSVGAEVERRSTVVSVASKAGRFGPLVFVTVEHVYRTSAGEAVREEQDLVYRGVSQEGSAAAPEARPAPEQGSAQADRTRVVEPSPVLLFRFSALTFNGHRIHYDRPYATGVEGYPGLVVHGPLQAALLLDLATAMRGGEPPKHFAFRARRPLFDAGPFAVNGAWRGDGALGLWTGPDRAALHVEATASW